MAAPNRMSRNFSTAIHIGFAVLTVSCGQERGRPGSPESEAQADSSFRVALLTPGPITDQAWNSGAYAGLLRIQDSLGAHVSHIQTRTPADFEENFRQYGAHGYDLVFGHGFEFQDAGARVAPDYPNTVYITSSGSRRLPNLAPMVFGFDEVCYLAGMLAGSLTESNIIGAIAGTELPTVKTSFQAYEAGARAANPRVQVLRSYVGNWEDASTGKELALAQIARGADILFQNADAAGLGIFQAVKEARERGRKIYAIGANVDQSSVAPQVIIASAVIDLPRAFLSVAREVKSGNFTSRIMYLGAKQDIVRLAINPSLAHLVPHSLRARLDSTERAIEAGTLRPLQAASGDTPTER
ncbi:MAG: BMP family protein [Gemmatimonadaceae bacterium]